MTIHISHAHKVVGVPVRDDLVNLFPDAKRATHHGNELLLLPHEFTTTKLLRNMGYDVPAPVNGQYDFPGGTPFEVQRKTVALLTTNQRAYVLNGMGTGKTKSALWAYDYLRSQGLARRALVVAPLSTLNFTWSREIFNTLPHLSNTVLHHYSKGKRLERLASDHDVYIINPDGLSVLFEALKARTDIDTLILDELAMFRNGSAQRSKLARALAERMTWVWGMTGSPTPNEPTDAWGQCRIITPHTVPKFFGRFRDEVMNKVTQFKYVPKKDAAETVFRVMQPAVRFTLDDVVELPEVVERTIDIDMGKKQELVYAELRKNSYSLIQSKEITAVNAGAVLNKLLQVSLGYVYTRERQVVGLDNDLRLDTLVDAINSTDRKVLVFVPFTHALDGVVDRLRREGIDVARICGDTSKGERDKVFHLFQQSDKYRVIAAHPATMSHGLTLTAADTIIWFGPTTSLETFEQANARIRRIGQAHKQQVLMFQSTDAERKIYARLRAKQAIQDNLLELFEDAS